MGRGPAVPGLGRRTTDGTEAETQTGATAGETAVESNEDGKIGDPKPLAGTEESMKDLRKNAPAITGEFLEALKLLASWALSSGPHWPLPETGTEERKALPRLGPA